MPHVAGSETVKTAKSIYVSDLEDDYLTGDEVNIAIRAIERIKEQEQEEHATNEKKSIS